MAEQGATPREDTGKSGKWRARNALFALVALLGLAAVVAALIPAVLSSRSGTRFLARLASGRIAGSVSFRSLSLNWGTSQVVEGLVVQDARGVEVIAIEHMANDRSLWRLVRSGGEELGTTTITGLRADIVADEDGDTNLMKALRVPGPARKQAGFVPVLPFGALRLDDSRVVVTVPGSEAVTFDIGGLHIDLPSPQKPLRVALEMATRQGDLAGTMTVRALAENAVDSRRRFQPLAARVELDAAASNLPVEGVDGAFGFGGLLSSALGRQANLSVRTTADLARADFDVTFAAPRLQARINAIYENGVLTLGEAGKIDFTLSPALVAAMVRRFSPGSSLVLEHDAPLDVVLEKMSVPVLPPDLAGSSLAVQARAGGALRFAGLAEGLPLTVKTLDMAVGAEHPREKITVELSSDLLLGPDPGSARITAIVSDLFDDKGNVAVAKTKVRVDGKLQNVPTALFEGVAGPRGVVGELLGSSFNAHFAAGNPEQGKTALDLIVESGRFKADTAVIVGDRIELVRPVRIQARMTPRLLELAGAPAVALQGDGAVDLGISRLSVPLSGKGRSPSLKKITFEAVATVTPLAVSAGRAGVFGLGVTRMEVRADGMADIDYTVTSHLAAQEGVFSAAAGAEALALHIAGKAGIGDDGAVKGLSSVLKAESSALNISTAVEFDGKKGELSMTAPLKAEWSATADQLANIFKPSPGAYVPAGDVRMSLRVEPTRIPLKGYSPAALKAKASAQLPRLQLSRDGRAEALFHDLAVKAELDGAAGRLTAAAEAAAAFPGEEGSYPVTTDLALEHVVRNGAFDFDGSSLALELESRGLPTALAGMLFDGARRLPDLAGQQADVRAAVRKSPLKGGSGEATVEVQAERLKASAQLSLSETLALRKPLTLELTLTPQSWAALRGEADAAYTLAKHAVVTGTVSELRLPTAAGADMGEAAFRAKLQAGELVLRQQGSGREVGLRGLEIEASAQPLAAGAAVGMRGAVTGTKGDEGVVDAQLRMTNLIARDGSVDATAGDTHLGVTSSEVPVALVDGLLGLGGLAEAALGERIGLALSAVLKGGRGPFSLKATASHASLEAEGSVADGSLTLSKPLAAQIDVTEELGRRLLNKLHPIFETVKTAQEPLRVEIDSRGFVVPLKDFSVSRMTMPSLTVSSNKMILRKGGTLEMLILLATQFGGAKGLGSAGEMEVWFTPLVAELKGGVFRYSRRLDLLVDGRLHALSWGTVSVAGKSRYDLFLGLPSEALRKILGTDRVSQGEIFTFPLQGGEGKVDTKGILARASLDLGRVRGQYELSQKDPLLGLVAGELTKKVIGTEAGPVPPQSVTPLPWAGIVVPSPEPPSPASRPGGEPSSSPKPAAPAPEEIIKDVLDLFKK